MIKTIAISIIILSGVGTSAMAGNTIKPAAIDVTAGTLMFTFDETGISATHAEKPDYALRLTTKKDRVIAIRF